MRFQTPLVPAVLVRRYKRFLADCTLPCGRQVTAHCPNPGAMTGLATPGMPIWLEPNDDPRKKLRYGWRLAEPAPGLLVVIDTGLANRVVHGALAAGRIAGLDAPGNWRAELPYAGGSRVDFHHTADDGTQTFVEVKSVTLMRRDGLVEFPDSVTARGARHLDALAQMAGQGHRAVLLYLVMRSDCGRMTLAADIDPAYARAARRAAQAGVETLCMAAEIASTGIGIAGSLRFDPVDATAGLAPAPTLD